MSDVKITKTHFERCEPVSKEILRKAKEEKDYRARSVNNEIGQASKEAAVYLAGQARGRVTVVINASDWERIFGRKNA